MDKVEYKNKKAKKQNKTKNHTAGFLSIRLREGFYFGGCAQNINVAPLSTPLLP